jgi:hypothetical protein
MTIECSDVPSERSLSAFLSVMVKCIIIYVLCNRWKLVRGESGAENRRSMARWLVLVLLLTVVLPTLGDKAKTGKPKKDIRDYNDADLERLYEEWEVCQAIVFS